MYRVLWLTERGHRHQQAALYAAPDELNVSINRQPDPELLEHLLSNTDFLISERRGYVGQSVIDVAPNLKLVVRLGSLVDDIDLQALYNADVRLSCQPVLGTIMVAEHCLMMSLALIKNLMAAHTLAHSNDSHRMVARTDEDTFRYNWAGMATVGNLYGKSISIVGMGEIGVELARRFQAFHPRAVYYYKRQRFSPEIEHDLGITYAETLDNALQNAEILIMLLPYSPMTDSLINASAFSKLPRGAVVVQAGSGSTIDERALYSALRSGHLGGAAVDTFEYEPLLPDHPLLQLSQDPTSNVILTPHVAGATLPPSLISRVHDYEEIIRFIRNQPLQYEVNLEAHLAKN